MNDSKYFTIVSEEAGAVSCPAKKQDGVFGKRAEYIPRDSLGKSIFKGKKSCSWLFPA
jgi:hypothetical protein